MHTTITQGRSPSESGAAHAASDCQMCFLMLSRLNALARSRNHSHCMEAHDQHPQAPRPILTSIVRPAPWRWKRPPPS